MQRKACYLALAITLDGDREVLGIWFQETEGAKFWMQVLTDLKKRGVRDILICCVDGLKGSRSDRGRLPETTVQTCIVHLIRQSCATSRAASTNRSSATCDRSTPPSTPTTPTPRSRRSTRSGAAVPRDHPGLARRWEHVTPFLAFPPEVRRVIYTTNAIEALNRQLRKAIKTKGSFPNEDAARKLVYLAIQNAVPQWTRTRNWTTALLAFKIHFGDRLPD